MSISSDGQITYGVILSKDQELPWDKFDGEFDPWWLDVCEYEPPFQVFGLDGDYLSGKEPSKDAMKQFWDHRDDFLSKNPPPYELHLFCSYEYPQYILALPKSHLRVWRGSYLKIDDSNLPVSSQEQDEDLVAFCEKYGFEIEAGPGLFLTSLYG